MEQRQFRQNATSLPTGTGSNLHKLSPAIWGRFPWATIRKRPELGRLFYDDFQDAPLIPTETTQIGYGKYKVFNTGAGTVVPLSAVNSVEIAGGAMSNTLDTDNDSGSLAQAYPMYRLSGAKATMGKLYFEACYAQNSIVTNLASGFFGLAETDQMTLATAVPLNAGDPITNTWSGIGFRIAEDGLGVVDTVVTDRATSFTNIGATEGGTLAANVFRKFGMLVDPDDSARCVRFFLDNVECATAYTKAQVIATTNLKANALGLVWANCADSAGTTFAGYMKWWAVGQLNPGVAA